MAFLMKSAGWTTLMILCMAMAAYEVAEAGGISCARVSSILSPCIPYAAAGKATTPPAACCSGIKSLNDLAKTTPDRQAVCKCLKSIVRAYPSDIVEGLPGKCGVSLPYKISSSMDCKRVK